MKILGEKALYETIKEKNLGTDIHNVVNLPLIY